MSYQIYTGVWTNWSHGRVQGLTLTLNARDGALLTAFLAIFVALMSVLLWRFICYVAHQLRVPKTGGDKLSSEIQIILRNTATPATGAWTFLTHGLKDGRSSFIRLIPWMLVSTVFFAAFAVAAIFSSLIAKSLGNARLIRSSTCGFPESLMSDYMLASPKLNNDSFTAAAYARDCYGNDPNAPQCARMPTPMITYTIDTNASCPFASGLCAYGDTAAVNMTTRMIDSREDLGINSPDDHRIQYQLTKTCAPINTTGRVNRYIATPNDIIQAPGDWIFEYHLGASTAYQDSARDPELTTFVYNNHTVYSMSGYVLTSNSAYANPSEDDWLWKPIPELLQLDADMSIFFLEASTITFLASNNDPWFGAHIARETNTTFGTVYDCDQWVSTMVCTEQIRICNPTSHVCSPYQGYGPLTDYATRSDNPLKLNVNQLAILTRTYVHLVTAGLSDQVEQRRQAALRAAEKANGRLQFPIPDTQWIVEVRSWFDTALARFQLLSLEYATGPSDPIYASYYNLTNDTPELVELCQNQIVNDASTTTSFSVLGLAIVLAFGGLAIVLNQLGEVTVGNIQKATGKGKQRRARWISDDAIKMHAVIWHTEHGHSVPSETDTLVSQEKERSNYSIPVSTETEPSYEGTPMIPSSQENRSRLLDPYGSPLVKRDTHYKAQD